MINIYMQKAFSSSELLEKAMGRERYIYICILHRYRDWTHAFSGVSQCSQLQSWCLVTSRSECIPVHVFSQFFGGEKVVAKLTSYAGPASTLLNSNEWQHECHSYAYIVFFPHRDHVELYSFLACVQAAAWNCGQVPASDSGIWSSASWRLTTINTQIYPL